MIWKVYFDMDEVLVDFNQSIFNHSGESVAYWINKWDDIDYSQFKIESRNPIRTVMETHIPNGLFKNAPENEGFFQMIQMMDWLHSKGIQVEILSSVTGEFYADEIINQKKEWLKSRNISYKANFTKGSKLKKNYAGEGIVLVDDFEDNINAFVDSGGIGVLFQGFDIFSQDFDHLFPDYKIELEKKKKLKTKP